jgi:hypothetical protein
MLKRTEEEIARSKKRINLLLLVVDGLLLAYLIFVLLQHLFA